MSLPYLSLAWIEEADRLLRAVPLDPPVPEPGFSVETVVTGGPNGDDGYVVEFRGATMTARHAPPGGGATVRLTQDRAVAVAVARGERSAQQAFLAADIQVGGDVATLIAHAGLVAKIGDVLAPLRERTTFPST